MIAITKMGLDRVAADTYAKNHRCGDCDSPLSVAWGGVWGIDDFVIRCGNDINHNTTAKVDLSEYYNEMKSKMGWRDKLLAQQIGNKAELILRPYETLPRLTAKQATDVVITLWPDAPKAEITKAVMVCTQYGLNPLMKHVFLIPFKNKDTGKTTYEMVLGIKASRIIASKSGRYSYIDGTPRLMTPDEQTSIYGDVDTKNVWAITKLKDRDGNIFPGYGSWPKDANVKGADKGNTKANMAMIRSERQALDKMCPGQLPRDAGTVDELYVDRPAPTVKVESGPERTVNEKTGEITEGEYKETGAPEGENHSEDPAQAADFKEMSEQADVERRDDLIKKADAMLARPIDIEQSKEAVKPPEKLKAKPRDPATVTTISQLANAVFADFGIQPKDAAKELGYENLKDLAIKPSDAYLTIQKNREKQP